MSTQPHDPLVALAWHGAFSPLPDQGIYKDRYIGHASFPAEAVRAFVSKGYAEEHAAGETQRAMFPTRVGLETALRRAPPELAENDRILALFGTRNWEVQVRGRSALVGVFITMTSGLQIITGLGGLLQAESRSASTHLEVIGGLIPSSIAADLQGYGSSDTPGFETVQVPGEVSDLVNLARRYRFILEVGPQVDTAALFQWAGELPRLIGRLAIRDLVHALRITDPVFADAIEEQGIDGVLGERDVDPGLEALP